MKARLAKLPRGKEIVAYCRGPYGTRCIEVRPLKTKGFRAMRLKTAFPNGARRVFLSSSARNRDKVRSFHATPVSTKEKDLWLRKQS